MAADNIAKAQAAPTRRQNLVKRACDPCKVRKIKCSELSPCSGCITAGIECTFNRLPSTRGPRTLRAKTIRRIAKTRQDGGSQPADLASTAEGDTMALLEMLDVYGGRLFPIWPIVDAVQLSDTLRTDPSDHRALHLARSVALATTAQLKLNSTWQGDVDRIERDAQADKSDLLDSLRVSFFLHIHYENQSAGGTKSLLYLREAITVAQILRIDREATYASLPDAEQQLLRRILWLLFITERGVAMLHKLPVVLRPNTIFPWQSGHLPNDQVLPAFVKLVHLFWVFDQSGIFELLRNSDADVSSMESLARGCLELLQHKLQDLSTGDGGFGNDVQRADMCVTRQWMRAVLWRAALRFGIVVPGTNPIDVAGEFLSLVSQLPTSALESQGQTLEFKTYEIATAVVDAVAEHYPVLALGRPRDVLGGLYGILASSRGGNKTLLSLLNSKLATSHPDLRILIQPSSLPPADQTPAGATMSQSAETWDFAAGEGVIGQYSEDRDLQSAMADLSWPPLDLGNLLRSPSPVTRLLLDNAMANQQLPMG